MFTPLRVPRRVVIFSAICFELDALRWGLITIRLAGLAIVDAARIDREAASGWQRRTGHSGACGAFVAVGTVAIVNGAAVAVKGFC